MEKNYDKDAGKFAGRRIPPTLWSPIVPTKTSNTGRIKKHWLTETICAFPCLPAGRKSVITIIEIDYSSLDKPL